MTDALFIHAGGMMSYERVHVPPPRMHQMVGGICDPNDPYGAVAVTYIRDEFRYVHRGGMSTIMEYFYRSPGISAAEASRVMMKRYEV